MPWDEASAWIVPCGAPHFFRQLHHYALLFHDEVLEALALGIRTTACGYGAGHRKRLC